MLNDLKVILKDTRRHLMTGVSHMIPFVVAGGILLALSVVMTGKAGVPESGVYKDLFFIGVAGFELMVPILAAYIGYSISERAALAPAAIGALVGSKMGTGFLGGLIAGLLGGIVVYYLKKIKVPKVFRSVMPIFVIPIVGTFIVAGLMQWVIGTPIAGLTTSLTNFLEGMRGANIVILATIMGCMIAFDMGGPVNKVAYAFVIMMVSEGVYNIPGISSVAVATPPIGVGLATFLARKKYTSEDREAGLAAILMGCVGITEGAIPFAAKSPLKVIPTLMAGSVVGGVTAALLKVESMAAWAGIIVLPVVKNRVGFLIALLAGSLTTAILLNLVLKNQNVEKKDEVSSSDDVDLEFGM